MNGNYLDGTLAVGVTPTFPASCLVWLNDFFNPPLPIRSCDPAPVFGLLLQGNGISVDICFLFFKKFCFQVMTQSFHSFSSEAVILLHLFFSSSAFFL